MMSNSIVFDYVIVGGGTAGSVLASRLSEDPEVRVLVIEAGEDLTDDPRILAPSMWPTLFETPANWGFKTTPQAGLHERELPFTQGRLLGGSSAINGMNFTPNTRDIIEAWVGLGNEGWEWEKFSLSFDKCYTSPSQQPDRSNGPIKLSLQNDPENQWPSLWSRTLTKLGYGQRGDIFKGHVTGEFSNTDSIDPVTRTRSYAANTYLRQALQRNNVVVWTETSVEKVLFRIEDGLTIADGVQFTQNGDSSTAKATREVILAAGAVNSPRLLELSGVGNAELLQRLGINTVIENEFVGENLQNHLLASVSIQVREGLKTMDPIMRQEQTALEAGMEAYSRQAGPLASSGTNPVAHMPFPGIQTADGKADLERLLSDMIQKSGGAAICAKKTASPSRAQEKFLASNLGSPDQTSGCFIAFPGYVWFQPDGTTAPPPSGTDNFLSLALISSHPLSRGSLHITSSTAAADPSQISIDPGYFKHPLDLEIMARHLQFFDTIINTEPLASHLQPGGKRNPGAPPNFADLEQAKDYLRRTAVGANHPIGTCAMMSQELGGVVDSKLRVYGCPNLRVCDASIIPLLPRANLLATVYGVAEHAATIIRGH